MRTVYHARSVVWVAVEEGRRWDSRPTMRSRRCLKTRWRTAVDGAAEIASVVKPHGLRWANFAVAAMMKSQGGMTPHLVGWKVSVVHRVMCLSRICEDCPWLAHVFDGEFRMLVRMNFLGKGDTMNK